MSQPGLTDEQIDELLDALLDFRDALLNLTDRFHQRMASVEQEMSVIRQGPSKSYDKLSKTISRPERMVLADLSVEPEGDFQPTRLKQEPKEELYDLGEEEDFALLDFDDDDDDF